MEDHRQIIKALTLSQLLLETLDAIEDKDLFKQQLKHQTSRYKYFLEKHTDIHITNLYRTDENLMLDMAKFTEEYVEGSIEEMVLSVES